MQRCEKKFLLWEQIWNMMETGAPSAALEGYDVEDLIK